MSNPWGGQVQWMTWLLDRMDVGRTYWRNATTEYDTAYTEFYFGDPNVGLEYSILAGMDLCVAVGMLSNLDDGWYPDDTLHEYIQMWATANMDTILNAMLQASFDQLTKFVGITDAFKSAIWDKPFNAEFYAALARGFRQ